MSIYVTDNFVDKKYLKNAEEVKKETDDIKSELISVFNPVAHDLLYEVIAPEIEKAVKKGRYSCIVQLPHRYDYPNKYNLEIEDPEMRIICEIITKWLSTLDYNVIYSRIFSMEISWEDV